MDKRAIDEKLANGYILYSTILEIVGKPKEHLDSTFATFIDGIKANPTYTVISCDVAPAMEVDESKTMFSAFAEMQILVKNMSLLYDFCFEYMPASVQIIEPQSLSYKAIDASSMLNDFIARIHTIDMHAKELNQKNRLLADNLRIMIKNGIVLCLDRKPHTAEVLANAVGIEAGQIKPLLDELIKDERVSEENGLFSIAGRSIKNKD